MPEEDKGLTSRIGPVEVDWPRTIGYYGGIGLATAFGLIEPPLAIFIGAIPLLKMLNRPQASVPTRFVAQVLDGASKPVGGSDEAVFRLKSENGSAKHRSSVYNEARQLANRARKQTQA